MSLFPMGAQFIILQKIASMRTINALKGNDREDDEFLCTFKYFV